jgi:hypothetical protein
MKDSSFQSRLNGDGGAFVADSALNGGFRTCISSSGP